MTRKRTFAHHPCHKAGPLNLEYAAAAYERMQAQRDFWDRDDEGWSWNDPYVKAAGSVEKTALGRILREGHRQDTYTYTQKQAL